MMFGKGLTLVAGKSMKAYLDEKVMRDIEFGDWSWATEQDSSIQVSINNGCTGVNINASQLARIGYLFLNEGNWNGKQLINKEFVKAALSVQVSESVPVFEGERKNAQGSGSYGFNWWVNSEEGLSKMPHAPLRTAYLSGLNHNMCFVIPEWDMVIVRMGDDKNPELPKHQVWDGFFKILKDGIQ
jgi:CubicO group peptidase (beta-lactamase class C family)